MRHSDVRVHATAHVFHDGRRCRMGLPETRRREIVPEAVHGTRG